MSNNDTNDGLPTHSQSTATTSPAAAQQRPKRHIGFGWRLAFRSRSGQARGFLRFWPFYQWLNQQFQRHHPIPNAPYNLFEVQYGRFHGKPITLPDGTHIRRGDRVLVLHINNKKIAGPAGFLSPWEQVRMMRGDLQALAAWAATPSFPQNIRALYGYTLLSRGAPRMGFTVRTRPSTWYTRLNAFFLMGLLVLYNPAGRDRLAHGTTYDTEPSETWMSLKELERRYNARQPAEAST